MVRQDVTPAQETYPRTFVGLCVAFDLHRANDTTTRERGEITAQRWLGVTKRGSIPEYEVTILGKSGKAVLARVTEDHVQTL